MRALEAEVVDAVWVATEALLPPRPEHPLGCHRPRVPDRLCLWALLIRLTTGASWVDIEAILDHQVSDTTLRARRDEWITAGVFERLRSRGARRVRPASSDSTDPRSPSTARCTRPPAAARTPVRTPLIVGSWAGSGRSPSTATASRSAGRPTAPTATTCACSSPPSTTSRAAGLLVDIDTIHLDRGYDSGAVRERLAHYGLSDAVIQRRGTKQPGKKQPVRLGLRWIVEARQHMVVELRPTAPQHRPPNPPPPRRPLPRHRRTHRRQAHHLAQPLEHDLTPIRSGP